MSVSAISAQVAQTAQANQTSLLNTTDVSTTVTSTDPTVLQNQISQLSSAVTQLQGDGGSTTQIQKMQQAILTAQNQIKKQEQLAEEKKASEQSANIQSAVKSQKGLDIQA